MAAFVFGQRGKQLLSELKRSDWLPAYNSDAVRQVIEETTAFYDEMVATLQYVNRLLGLPSLSYPFLDSSHRGQGFEMENDVSTACGVVVHFSSLLRNKRCLLAYMFFLFSHPPHYLTPLQ